MSFQKVQIVFDPGKWKEDPTAVFALYGSYNDLAVVMDEEELDKMIAEDDADSMVDYCADATSDY